MDTPRELSVTPHVFDWHTLCTDTLDTCILTVTPHVTDTPHVLTNTWYEETHLLYWLKHLLLTYTLISSCTDWHNTTCWHTSCIEGDTSCNDWHTSCNDWYVSCLSWHIYTLSTPHVLTDATHILTHLLYGLTYFMSWLTLLIYIAHAMTEKVRKKFGNTDMDNQFHCNLILKIYC